MATILLDNVKVTCATTPHVADTAAAGDTQIDGTPVDMVGFEGVMYLTHIIDTTGDSTNEYLQIVGLESASSGGTFVSHTTSFAVRANTTAGSAFDDMAVILDIYNPKDRWQKPRLTSSTGVFRGMCYAIRYNNRRGVCSQTTNADEVCASLNVVTPTTA